MYELIATYLEGRQFVSTGSINGDVLTAEYCSLQANTMITFAKQSGWDITREWMNTITDTKSFMAIKDGLTAIVECKYQG